MNIGQASRASGISAKMIRYYEQIGLMAAPPRTGSNYRSFGMREVKELRFNRRGRLLGFTIEDINELLSLWRDNGRPSRRVKAIAEHHIAELRSRIAGMQAMVDILQNLASCCAGDEQPDCPILDDLASGADPRGPGARSPQAA